LKLGFAGTPQFAVPALDALVRSGHAVAAVFTQPDRPAGRGQVLQLSAVKQRAAELGIPVHQPRSFKTGDAEAALRGLELDALIVVAYGLILPPGVLAAPRLGCFNIHASLLPRWRGAAPIQRALLAGDAATGITIMRMEAGLDTGPMLAVRELAIGDRETGGTLHDRLAALGAELIVNALEGVASGVIHGTPQPQTGVTYADKLNKREALIDWNDDAQGILRRVRAFNPWPIAETRLDGAQLRVWEAELTPSAEPAPSVAPAPAGGLRGSAISATPLPGTVFRISNDGVDVACGRGALRLLRLQLAGRKPLATREFIKAQRLEGAIFATPPSAPRP
jgi:methionyl-tRNA formyltransferase